MKFATINDIIEHYEKQNDNKREDEANETDNSE